MDETSSKDKVKITVLWKGRKYEDQEYPENDRVAAVIKTFLTKHAHDELPELSKYHMFLLDDPPKQVDSSKLINDVVEPDHFLLLNKKEGHVENSGDIMVATIIAAYTAVLFSVAMWLLVSVWPKSQQEYNLTTARTVYIAWTGPSFSMGPETLVLLVMILSGVVGACVFSAFALSHHLGLLKDFDKSWAAWYLTRPLIGAGLAVILDLLIQSSVFTAGTGGNSKNIIGLSGVAALAGIFSEDAIKKLNEVSDTLFGRSASRSSTQNSTNRVN